MFSRVGSVVLTPYRKGMERRTWQVPHKWGPSILLGFQLQCDGLPAMEFTFPCMQTLCLAPATLYEDLPVFSEMLYNMNLFWWHVYCALIVTLLIFHPAFCPPNPNPLLAFSLPPTLLITGLYEYSWVVETNTCILFSNPLRPLLSHMRLLGHFHVLLESLYCLHMESLITCILITQQNPTELEVFLHPYRTKHNYETKKKKDTYSTRAPYGN